MKYAKKIVVYVLVFAMLFTGMSNVNNTQVSAKAKKPSVKAHAFYLLDATSGKEILSQNKNKKIYPASTVKLLTALVVLDHADVNKQFKYTKKLRKTIPADAAALNLTLNRRYTVKNYLHMLLMVSDAASATTLAVGVAGSLNNFAVMMNEKAKSLGMTKSSFDNPIGLDKGNGYKKTYTTAADFIKVSKAAMENSVIRAIVAKKKYTVRPVGVKKSFVIQNTNAFYTWYKSLVKNAKYKIIGSKTGTTQAAGHALIATAVDSEGKEVICAFFGKDTKERMYKDIKKLLNYAYAS